MLLVSICTSSLAVVDLLQRSIRPQIVTTFELPDCQDMWTLVGPPDLTKSVEEDKTVSTVSDLC